MEKKMYSSIKNLQSTIDCYMKGPTEKQKKCKQELVPIANNWYSWQEDPNNPLHCTESKKKTG